MSQEESQDQGQSERIDTGTSGASMQEIVPRLYLGDVKAATNIEDLCSNHISFVLTISCMSLSSVTCEAYRMARISHIQISKLDTSGEDMLSVLGPVCDMIDGQLARGKTVLVHCKRGSSRSATVVIAYVMRREKMSRDEASGFVWAKRGVVKPNPGFLDQLKVWEQCKHDLQNRSIEDRETKSDSVCTDCRSESEEKMVQGEEGAKEEAENVEAGQEDKSESDEVKERYNDEGEKGEIENGSAKRQEPRES